MFIFRVVYYLAVLLFVSTIGVQAEQLPKIKNENILTFFGNIDNYNTDQNHLEIDLETLQSMDAVVFETSSIWYSGTVEFTGVSLKEILEYAGAKGGKVNAIALNDYSVEIPLDTIEDGEPIIAYLMDGEVMSPRDKGPLWIVYPYDAKPKFRSELIYSRSIWQLNRIEIVE